MMASTSAIGRLLELAVRVADRTHVVLLEKMCRAPLRCRRSGRSSAVTAERYYEKGTCVAMSQNAYVSLTPRAHGGCAGSP